MEILIPMGFRRAISLSQTQLDCEVGSSNEKLVASLSHLYPKLRWLPSMFALHCGFCLKTFRIVIIPTMEQRELTLRQSSS